MASSKNLLKHKPDWKKLEEDIQEDSHISFYDKSSIDRFIDRHTAYWRNKFTRKNI